jgi:hypothetical protein
LSEDGVASSEEAGKCEQDDPLEPDCRDYPADFGPPFTMDQTKQGEIVQASPPITAEEAQAALRRIREAS